MAKNIVAEPLSEVIERVIAEPQVRVEEPVLTKPMLSGLIYGEIVFWMMLGAMVIAIAGLVTYLRFGGYFDATSLLNHLWQGSSTTTIWKEVGHVSQPLTWYSCLSMLAKGDMLAVLGLVTVAVAAVVGMWGAFVGMLRSKNYLYTVFALVIAVVLTLSALGILKLEM
jgi:hypothetical protein